MGLKISTSQLGKDGQFSSCPNPNNFKILRMITLLDWIVVEIKYPDCSNYEGRKILVFNSPIDDLLKQKSIDPHFLDNKEYISPVARFEPTESGWNFALLFIQSVVKN